MSKKGAAAAATDDAANKDDKSKAADDAEAAAGASGGGKKPDDDAGDSAAVKKQEKTYTKAEIDAAAKKAVEDAKKKWDDEKDLSELERFKKENEELREAARLRDAREEVQAALERAGAKSPGLMFGSIKGDLAFDEKTGKVKNLEDIVKSLQSDYPEQFGEEKPDGTIDGGKGQQGQGEKLTKEKLAAMTPAEINTLPWEEVSKVMAEK